MQGPGDTAMNNCLILKGDICHTPVLGEIETLENGYVISVDGICRGVFSELPEEYRGLPVKEFRDALIIPGMSDLHTHASQFAYRGMGMDEELLDWLENWAFPEECKFADPAYTEKAYGLFAESMRKSATTRALIFATIHREATLALMEKLEDTGIVSYVGKVNMNRNSPDSLNEGSTEEAVKNTELWVKEALAKKFDHTFPIITPRFIPTCTDDLLQELGRVAREHHLPVQSHLSENPEEGEWVLELMPDISFYGEGYEKYGLFGKDVPTVMAHCIYSNPEEVELMRKNGVFIAHCPNSNMNIRSGIAPVRKYLQKGMRLGLGTDVAGGMSLSMFRAITDTIQMSKLYWRLIDQEAKALTFAEAFYLATKGGGAFFGKVGSFEPGYAFDAVVISDRRFTTLRKLTLKQRLEQAVNLGLDLNCLIAKYAEGRECLCIPDKA